MDKKENMNESKENKNKNKNKKYLLNSETFSSFSSNSPEN